MSISILFEKNSLMLRAEHDALSLDDAKTCAKHLAEQQGQSLVVLDFLKVHSIDATALKLLDTLAEPESENSPKIIVLARRRLIDKLKNHPLGTAALCYMDLRDESEKKPAVPHPIPPDRGTKRLVEVALNAVSYAFEFYGKIKVNTGEARFWSESDAPTIEIAGNAGLVGKDFRGSLTLAFPLKTFLAVVSRIIDKPCTQIETSNRDWPAELLNVVLGQTRAALSQEGVEISSSIPTVVHGAAFEMIHSKAASCVVVPIDTDCGELFLQIATLLAD